MLRDRQLLQRHTKACSLVYTGWRLWEFRIAEEDAHQDWYPISKPCACTQVKKLKVSLEDARRRMGAQSRSLQQHWRRGITMGDTVRLLSDIHSIVDTPQRLQRLEEAKARLPGCMGA